MVKKELLQEMKVEIEPISVPIPWPSFMKEEPMENNALASVHTNATQKHSLLKTMSFWKSDSNMMGVIIL